MKKVTQISLVIFQMILITTSSFGQICSGGGAPATASFTLAGKNSVNVFNSNGNARGTLAVAFAGDVVGIQVSDVSLNTFGGSYCSEAVIEIADVRNTAANYVDITSSLQASGSPCADLPLTEYFDLTTVGFEFPTNGTSVYWELYETFNDIAGADATYTAGTVTVYVCPTGQVLPLELASFTGKTEPSSNILQWETLSEKNVQWHIVERSIDGIKWSEVDREEGQMDSQTSLKYELEDRTPLAKSYYRLRSVDFDGQENISNSIILTRKSDQFGITAAFPSPAKDKITIQFGSLKEENIVIRITDITGRLVFEQQFAAEKGINEVPVQLNTLQAGMYLVGISNSSVQATPVRIIKE